MSENAALPESFAEIADDFHALGGKDRLQLLLEFSNGLPPLPDRYAEHPELLEPVPECQSPIFLATEVDGTGREATAHLFFSAPPEAPTTRGFASILAEALDGRSVGDVLDTPDAVTGQLGLAEVVSPLRLNGMSGMLARIKRQLHEKAGL
ncbi:MULTISPECIES: SufE family protein [Brachybacterium]|uniref:Cysteine desulfuration protein SufE n=1 Tax=Brachybacterium fresconis TaxID=173363 RepID=A0ABS4YMI4_9MICO|nr:MULTISPECIES: SufE family protein [Brachybacterium]MBP2410012.1 cysteine desulfuration protein SufE [Brachybacterium fresconis]MDN5687968.1 SufE family protein [Brachybacterium sp.]